MQIIRDESKKKRKGNKNEIKHHGLFLKERKNFKRYLAKIHHRTPDTDIVEKVHSDLNSFFSKSERSGPAYWCA